MEDFKAWVDRLLTHDRAHIVVDLVAHTLTGDHARIKQIVRDPDEVDAVFTRALLEHAVHAVESLAAHMFPENDHVGVELLAVLPQLV